MSLKRYLMILILASWNWGSWAFLLDYPYNVSFKKSNFPYWSIYRLIHEKNPCLNGSAESLSCVSYFFLPPPLPSIFSLRAFVLNNGAIYSLSKTKTIPASLQEYLRFVSLLAVGYLHKKSLYSLSVKDAFVTSILIFINRLFFAVIVTWLLICGKLFSL